MTSYQCGLLGVYQASCSQTVGDWPKIRLSAAAGSVICKGRPKRLLLPNCALSANGWLMNLAATYPTRIKPSGEQETRISPICSARDRFAFNILLSERCVPATCAPDR